MKNKLIATLVALSLILGIGCGQSIGTAGRVGGHSPMMGGGGGTGQQGIDRKSDTPAEQSQGETGHNHGVPNTGGTPDTPRSYQGHGMPMHCF